MKTFSIILSIVSTLLFLFVVALMQYGYHNGPAWLYRCQNGDPALFPFMTGLAALGCCMASCAFAANCLIGPPRQ